MQIPSEPQLWCSGARAFRFGSLFTETATATLSVQCRFVRRSADMRRVIPGLALAAFVAWTVSPVIAEVKTIRGEVVDQICVKKDATKRGAAHAGCAMSCAKKGNAMAIVTSDGIYTITGAYANDNNAKLLEFVAKDVEAKGTVTQKDGAWQIDVSSMQAAKSSM
jgi:hypothetical protein